MDLSLPDSLGQPTRVLPPEGFTVLTSYRGFWCPFCQGFMKGLQAQGLGPPVRLLAVSADPPEASEKFRQKFGITFPILSDPQLVTVDLLKLPKFGKHTQALRYPKKAFLQPSVLMWSAEGKLLFEWRMKTSLFNLFGAVKRMAPEEIAGKARQLSGGA